MRATVFSRTHNFLNVVRAKALSAGLKSTSSTPRHRAAGVIEVCRLHAASLNVDRRGLPRGLRRRRGHVLHRAAALVEVFKQAEELEERLWVLPILFSVQNAAAEERVAEGLGVASDLGEREVDVAQVGLGVAVCGKDSRTEVAACQETHDRAEDHS